MYRTCSRCGKFYPAAESCNCRKYKRIYKSDEERKLRSKNVWKVKSEEIRAKANNLCEVCRDKGRYIFNNLEVHHIHKVKDNPDLLLDDFNLICLCVTCHKKADKGEIDIDYLEQLAARREER